MFLLQIQLQQIIVQEHIPVKIALASLTFNSRASPPPTFKPNGPIVQFVITPIKFMWLRATIISLWDIWYDTHKKWREELLGCSCSVFFLLYGSFLRSNLSISKSVNKATEQCNPIKNQVGSTLFTFLLTLTPNQVRHPPPPLLRCQQI